MKKIVLDEVFPKKISVEERVYLAIKNGKKTYREIAREVKIKTGGHLSNAVNNLVDKGLITDRPCECGMHRIFKLAK